MLPQVKDRIKKVAIILFACTVPIIAIGAIFFKDANKGYLYCYQPYDRNFTKVVRGQKAFIIDDELDDRERILIYTLTGKIVKIHKDELLHTGYD